MIISPAVKWISIAVAVGLLILGFNLWLGARDRASEERGFGRAETQYKAAVTAANERAAADQRRLDLMTTTFGGLAQQRVQGVQLSVQPLVERISREITSNPIYRTCVVSPDILRDATAAAAAVNARLSASNPGPAQR